MSFTQPINGALVDNNDGTLVYTPEASFGGTDFFEYRLTDGAIVSDPVTVQVDVVSDPELLFSLLLDEGVGDIAVDNVPAQSDGQLVGGLSYSTDVPDGSDYSLAFDGIDDYIDLGEFDADRSGLTLALWFKAASFPGNFNDSRLISKATGVSDDEHIFMLSTIRLGADTRLRARIRVAGVTETLIAPTGNLSTDTWYHAAMTYDEDALSLYLDGVLVASSSVSGPIDQAPEVVVAVAAQPSGAGGRYFHGNLDAINIWQRALDAAEIVDLAMGEVSAPTAPTVAIALIGDSITNGGFGRPSYRRALWHKLQQAGFNVDFVGSRTSFFRGNPPNSELDFDLDHEGHWAREAGDIAGDIDGWLDGIHSRYCSYTPWH